MQLRKPIPFAALCLAVAVTCATAAPVAMHDDEHAPAEARPLLKEIRPGSPVLGHGSFDASLAAGGAYIRRMQADVADDPAENGINGSETPEDPDDAGWDWSQTAPVFHHSIVASPTNLSGVTAMGMLQAYLDAPDAALLLALGQTADDILAAGAGDHRTSSDMIFLMLYDDLAGNTGVYDAGARAKYDWRVANQGGGTAAGLAAYIRDSRAGYHNGIIPWDIGSYARAAAMLQTRYGTYAGDAAAIAEVLWQDSFNDNPGLFDVVDDAGWDPTYSNVDYWWYNLGISGLIEAFQSSGVHTGELPWLISRLKDSTTPAGAVCNSYGVHANDEDWQATAYAAMALGLVDAAHWQSWIGHWCSFIADTQDGSGGWVYGDGTHYPEVGGENTTALALGLPTSTCIVDDDFTGQASVDVYNAAHNTEYVWNYDAFDTIQEGVDNVFASTVLVGPGTYTEQVVITTNDLTLQGAGVGVTTIKSPAVLTASFLTDRKPVVFVNGADNVTIRDLTVDGDGKGNANYRFIGVAFWNGGGKLLSARITAVRDTPFSGTQHGVALYAYHTSGGPYALEVGDVTIDDFQKNGTAIYDTAVDIHDCTIVGAGTTTVTAQNGLQVGLGSTGTIRRTTISGCCWNGPTWTATGILAYDCPSLAISEMDGAYGITDCQTAAYVYDVNGSIDALNAVYADIPVPVAPAGVVGGNSLSSLTGQGNGGSVGDAPDRRPAMMDAEISRSLPGPDPTTSLFTLSVSNCCVTGNDQVGSVGLWSFSDGGAFTMTATNNRVTDWDYGLAASGSAALLTANDNAISSNVTAGYDNTGSGAAQDAEMNWWGDAAGPAGAGDDVLGAGVDYTPWRVSGSSSTPCGFTPTATTNTVSPVPPSGCINVANSCVTVPVNIARFDSTPMRAYHVTLQLTNLSLCGAGITEGTYLSGVGGTNFQVLNNGGGAYTVDCSILGLPCGATGVAGNLFDLHLGASGTGTGTVAITGVTLRDCSNAPIPGGAGAPASITYDMVPPVAVANLSAAQKKTLNDTNGTTQIQLTFAAPGDAAVVEVYRKGYGQYPEYDDCGGAAPSAPSYPPPAPWTLTAVTATGQYDEPAARDFWSYCVFTKDACENVSAVSNVTAGTLNYHLGDVSSGLPPFGSGNNSVTTADISLLGAYYGAVFDSACGEYVNDLDVGPTTDYSVDARPTTDNRVDFEDLMMFAINYGQVSLNGPAPGGSLVRGEEGTAPTLSLVFDRTSGATNTLHARLVLRQVESLAQGAHAFVAYDHTRLELVRATPGGLVAAENTFLRTLDTEKGTWIDAAVLGSGATFAGSGDIAVLEFRVRGPGARPSLTTSDLRSVDNSFLGDRPAGAPARIERAAARQPVGLAAGTQLLLARPNPFGGSTAIQFRMAAAGQADVRIYDLGGRLVRDLFSGAKEAGDHVIVWDGRGDRGELLGAGIYFARVTTPGHEAGLKLFRYR